MKTIIYSISILLSVLLVSCGGEKSEHNHNDHNHSEMSDGKYACPMKCEGEKTYSEKGMCPVCKMDLVEIQ